MDCSRRDLGAIFPILAALIGTRNEGAAQNLPSRCYEFSSLPEKTNPDTHNETRNVFDGATHDGIHVDMHITTLMPGLMPHPEHHHEWDELIMLQTGTLEVTIRDKKTRIGPGSVAYFYSNDQHGLKNIGDSPAQYFVLTLRE